MFGKTQRRKRENNSDENPMPSSEPKIAPEEIVKIESIKQKFLDSTDIIFNEVIIDENRKLNVVFVDGMVNSEIIDNFVLKPLIQETILKEAKTEKDIIDLIMLGTVYHCQRKLRDKLTDCYHDLLIGSLVLIFENSEKAVTFETKGFERRAVSEPTNENVLKGSKESFVEVLRINTALIRRRIPSSDLIISQLQMGRRTDTAVSVIYLEGIANKSIVEETKKRLNSVDIDGISSLGIIEACLRGRKYSLFPQALYTERTDKFCGNVLEGRIGIIADGFPLAIIVPVDINSFLQAPEDYAQNYFYSSMYRMMRYISALVSLVLPAFYVSITTFHPEMIPTKLAMAIIASKEGVPFPSYIEVLLMLGAFEVLLEAGMRLPKSVGQAVSIVGALVVGQAAISAKILSPGVVIIIAAAGITGFVIPSQDFSNTIRVCRLILVVCSITSGLYGVSIGSIVILYHLCDLEVLGVPYLSPFVSNEGKGMLNDTIIRKLWLKQKERPSNIYPEDSIRQR
ncbi:MAG: spore germination protein [Firmicutes bacterium HGW-Firmicutes-16]|nr:MAG: spore germination protein [Firmicutes bacterium HGW-Firmicutes-16]